MKRGKKVEPEASDAVRRVLAVAGWSPLADGLAAVSWWRYRYRPRDVDDYRFVDVRAGDRHVQISISPTGRSVRVFVDGEEAGGLAK